MKSVVEIIKGALPCPVYANNTNDLGECAIYDFNTTVYDRAKRLVRLKVTLYAAHMERGLELETMLDRALVPMGDSHLTATVTDCRRNGGGWLTDGDWHVRIAYYDIVMRA